MEFWNFRRSFRPRSGKLSESSRYDLGRHAHALCKLEGCLAALATATCLLGTTTCASTCGPDFHALLTTMSCTDCPFLQQYLPLRWHSGFANRGHAFQVWLGIPTWISYFSPPSLMALQLVEPFILPGVLLSFWVGWRASDNVHPARRRSWLHRAVWYFGGCLTMAWFTACLRVKSLALPPCSKN